MVTVATLLPVRWEPCRGCAHLTGMTPPARVHGDHRAALRGAAAAGAAAICAVAVLATGCSRGGPASGNGASISSASAGTSAGRTAAIPPSAAVAKPGAGQAASPAARLIPAQSIIYTASLTVRAASVPAAVQRATSIAASAGGYIASEHETTRPGQRQAAAASLQLKIPVAAYPATLGRLRAGLGTQVALSQQAQDVTEQVADVTSRVASAQAAIAQLRALLRRAGTVAGLLAVQDEINAQESDLEALQAQQRALARQTTFATVSLHLGGQHAAVQHQHRHGFAAGLAAGWRGLRSATTWLLTTLGAVLPFAVIVAVLGGIGYAGRRRLLRRRPGRTAAGAAPPGGS